MMKYLVAGKSVPPHGSGVGFRIVDLRLPVYSIATRKSTIGSRQSRYPLPRGGA